MVHSVSNKPATAGTALGPGRKDSQPEGGLGPSEVSLFTIPFFLIRFLSGLLFRSELTLNLNEDRAEERLFESSVLRFAGEPSLVQLFAGHKGPRQLRILSFVVLRRRFLPGES